MDPEALLFLMPIHPWDDPSFHSGGSVWENNVGASGESQIPVPAPSKPSGTCTTTSGWNRASADVWERLERSWLGKTSYRHAAHLKSSKDAPRPLSVWDSFSVWPWLQLEHRQRRLSDPREVDLLLCLRLDDKPKEQQRIFTCDSMECRLFSCDPPPRWEPLCSLAWSPVS